MHGVLEALGGELAAVGEEEPFAAAEAADGVGDEDLAALCLRSDARGEDDGCAEEIAVFGPVPAEVPTKPTDQREWPCRVNYKLTGIEPEFVALETGRFFFTESACRAAPPEAVTGGCVAELSGAPP